MVDIKFTICISTDYLKELRGNLMLLPMIKVGPIAKHLSISFMLKDHLYPWRMKVVSAIVDHIQDRYTPPVADPCRNLGKRVSQLRFALLDPLR